MFDSQLFTENEMTNTIILNKYWEFELFIERRGTRRPRATVFFFLFGFSSKETGAIQKGAAIEAIGHKTDSVINQNPSN